MREHCSLHQLETLSDRRLLKQASRLYRDGYRLVGSIAINMNEKSRGQKSINFLSFANLDNVRDRLFSNYGEDNVVQGPLVVSLDQKPYFMRGIGYWIDSSLIEAQQQRIQAEIEATPRELGA